MNRRSSSSRGLKTLGIAAVLCLALASAAGGCGSSGSSSSSSASTGESGGKSSGEGSLKVPGEPKQKSTGDNSIQAYGAAAGGSEKAEVAAAAHGFFVAMAAADYAGMCEALAASNREQLESFAQGEGSGTCAGALKALLNPAVAQEAKGAAAAKITSVRIKGGNAFAIFTPRGGSESYFVMKHEGDGWKAISVTPGTPLEPTASG